MELQVVRGEMKGVDHGAKSYCNKTMSSSSALRGNLFNQKPIKAKRRRGEKRRDEAKGRTRRKAAAWRGARASRVLYSAQVCFPKETLQKSHLVDIDQGM